MVVLTFPNELQDNVFELVNPPKEEGAVLLSVKIKEEISEETLGLLQAIGVKIIKPVK